MVCGAQYIYNNGSFEGRGRCYRSYHSESYTTSSDTSDTVCHDFQLSTTNHPKFCINECYILCILISMMCNVITHMCNVITHIQESRIQRQTIAIEMLFFFMYQYIFF
jgi:hypothetical protein